MPPTAALSGRLDDQLPAAGLPWPTAMLELTVMDIRRAGEFGRVLIDKLIRVDRLVESDPATRVVMLVRRARLDGVPAALRCRAAPYLAGAQAADALLDMASSKGRGRRRFQPSLERVLWEHMRRTLARHGGNKKATALALRITDNTLRRRLSLRLPLE